MAYSTSSRRVANTTGCPLLTHLTLPSPLVAEHLLHVGYDGYVLDLQHGDLGLSDALRILQASARNAAHPYARLDGIVPGDIARLLDNGCTGVIAPMVETVEQAAALVSACLYPPLGRRSFGPVRPDLYPETMAKGYANAANLAVRPMIQIESAAGVENARGLLSVPGIAGVYIGPADLAHSYGMGFETDWTEGPVREAISAISALGRELNVAVGIFCKDADYAARLNTEGLVDYVAVGGDLMLLNHAAQENLETFTSGSRIPALT